MMDPLGFLDEWRLLLLGVLILGSAPGAVLRLVVRMYPAQDARRRELMAELHSVPAHQRPLWVAEQLETAMFEGLSERLSARRRRSAVAKAVEDVYPSSPEAATSIESDLADVETVERLRRASFDPSSSEWLELANALMDYGYPRLVELGINGLPTGRRLNIDESRALAAEVVHVSVERFRTSSLPAWTPAEGRSIRSSFVAYCIAHLSEVYDDWRRRSPGPRLNWSD